MKWTMDWNSWKAAGRHGLTMLGTATAMGVYFGVINQDQASDITGNITSIFDSVEKIATSAVAIGALLAPIYASFFAARAASPESQQASVASRSDRVVVAIDPTKAAESTERLALVPEAKAVITSPVMANSTPNLKVVSPQSAAALNQGIGGIARS